MAQAHLHRIGYNVGDIDGIVGNKTQGALKAAGLHGLPLTDAAERLKTLATPPPPSPKKLKEGKLAVPGVDISISHFGQVRATRNADGADLHIRGSGRIVVDFIDS
jgi:peptidoglycan hydrolase-like protein with peptidoglycan-binding domain